MMGKLFTHGSRNGNSTTKFHSIVLIFNLFAGRALEAVSAVHMHYHSQYPNALPVFCSTC